MSLLQPTLLQGLEEETGAVRLSRPFGLYRALTRIAKALEEANSLQRERLCREFEDYARKVKSQGRKRRDLVLDQPSTEEWNERYREEHP